VAEDASRTVRSHAKQEVLAPPEHLDKASRRPADVAKFHLRAALCAPISRASPVVTGTPSSPHPCRSRIESRRMSYGRLALPLPLAPHVHLLGARRTGFARATRRRVQVPFRGRPRAGSCRGGPARTRSPRGRPCSRSPAALGRPLSVRTCEPHALDRPTTIWRVGRGAGRALPAGSKGSPPAARARPPATDPNPADWHLPSASP